MVRGAMKQLYDLETSIVFHDVTDVAADVARVFAQDREGTIKKCLIEMGWSPPGLPSVDESLLRVGRALMELRRERVLSQADVDLIYERIRAALQGGGAE